MLDMHLNGFSAALASSAPVPGGGGASALCGALGAALASMVCGLTAGKKKYAAVEADIQRILADAETLRVELLAQIDGDAAAFAPLAKAYSIPKDDPSRAETLESALHAACAAPLEIMRLAARAIELHAELADKGSALAISDVGVGALLCRSSLLGASLNVFINTRLMTDRACAEKFNAAADALIEKYVPMADAASGKVTARLRAER